MAETLIPIAVWEIRTSTCTVVFYVPVIPVPQTDSEEEWVQGGGAGALIPCDLS